MKISALPEEVRYLLDKPVADWPISVSLELIGGKWKPAILYLVGHDVRRFGEMRRCLPGISRGVLTHELRTLESSGMLSREVFAELPPLVEYRLTELGQSCLPLLHSLCQWGKLQADRG